MPSNHLPLWLTKVLHLETYYLLPYQILSIARRVSVTLNIFISQLTPPGAKSQAQASAVAAGAAITPQLQRQLMQLTQICRLNDAEATKLLQMELAPFKGDKELVGKLRKEMKGWVNLGSVKEHPEVTSAVARVIDNMKRKEKVEETED